MKQTIEERAELLYERERPVDRMDSPIENAYANGIRDGYIAGAIEQKWIDDDKCKDSTLSIEKFLERDKIAHYRGYLDGYGEGLRDVHREYIRLVRKSQEILIDMSAEWLKDNIGEAKVNEFKDYIKSLMYEDIS